MGAILKRPTLNFETTDLTQQQIPNENEGNIEGNYMS